jgi:RNA polymerase sigma-70 factor (ECF subfamily)
METTRSSDVPRDEELAAEAAAGSRAAFEELVSRYTLRLFHFLRRRSGSAEDTEDIVQETFLRAYRNIDRYDARWKFSTWLYTVAGRLAVSRHRTIKVRTLGLDPESLACQSPGPQEFLAAKEEGDELRRNIWGLARTLRPSEYEALWLRYAEAMPVKEIARALGKTQVGVRALLHRSRLKLGKKLGGTGRATALDAVSPVEHKLSIP